MNKNKQQPQCVNMFTMPAAATVPRAAVKRAPLRPLQTLPPLPSDPPAHPAQLTPVELICECGHSHRSESERKNAIQRRTYTGDTIHVACAAKPPKTMF